jgi:hypothetical protein
MLQLAIVVVLVPPGLRPVLRQSSWETLVAAGIVGSSVPYLLFDPMVSVAHALHGRLLVVGLDVSGIVLRIPVLAMASTVSVFIWIGWLVPRRKDHVTPPAGAGRHDSAS